MDSFPAMGEFRRVQGVMHLAFLGLLDAHQGESGGF
jgi:hypothetical protein